MSRSLRTFLLAPSRRSCHASSPYGRLEGQSSTDGGRQILPLELFSSAFVALPPFPLTARATGRLARKGRGGEGGGREIAQACFGLQTTLSVSSLSARAKPTAPWNVMLVRSKIASVAVDGEESVLSLCFGGGKGGGRIRGGREARGCKDWDGGVCRVDDWTL